LTNNPIGKGMSVLNTHAREGQIAVLVFVILLAAVAAVFWNWNYVTSMDWNIITLPENPALQMVLILVVIVVVLFAYAIYKAREPRIMRGG